MTMWVLVCFSILSTGLYGVVSSRIRLAQVMERRIMSEYMARAACAYFKTQRVRDEGSVDTIAKLKEVQEQELGRGKFKYILKDEESRININTSSADVLSRLPEFNTELAKKVSDSKLKPFHVKEEILMVDGVTKEIFDKCKGLITVYTKGEVNINTATPEVLKVLGFDDDLVELITEFRLGSDGKDLTEDDGVFESPGEILNKLKDTAMLYEEQQAKLLQFTSQNLLSTASKNFTLEIETTVLEKPAMRYNIVMDKDKIKRWQEF